MATKRFSVKIHHEGTNILIMLLLVLAALNVPVWLFFPPVVIPCIFTIGSVVIYSFVFNFFRCPQRHYRGSRRDVVISSVDGRVVAIEEVMEMEYIGGPAIMVSVFMSPLNVHANWFPVDGQVEYVKHHRGRFLSAYLPKASTDNERAMVGIRCRNGERIAVCQVAGAMARRIVTYAREGDASVIDRHLGFIKFGSRVDIYLPPDAQILVEMRQKTKGDITPLAKLGR